MRPYTPVEIITAGINDTRETFADLYLTLAELRERAAYEYHRAFVDHDASCGDGGRLPFHPAPAGFGGDEVAIPARPVRLDRLTDAGLQLYTHGIRTALQERAHLRQQIDDTVLDLERIHTVTDGTTAGLVASVLHHLDVVEHRRRTATGTASTRPVTAWSDAPVRIPGTTTYTTTVNNPVQQHPFG
ncbi:hypothetical protein IT072_20770 (plasmid) [Leifsonia sp. ZF2019]|uniref:hypothetical protein n=1 Tax=Leifsonia sp. ZF2019 TaxID=2781978 RepID=UPI001CBFADE4|nr:hypothetical protein [Leifsonia sp. ZF2019]UAJ81780.1 hypothetical protein IT072_20770 [Leifsonia sp. ZF2019]